MEGAATLLGVGVGASGRLGQRGQQVPGREAAAEGHGEPVVGTHPEEMAQLELGAPHIVVELEEEHGGGEGWLGSLDKIAKPEVNARLKEIKRGKEDREEAPVLKRWLDLAESETALKRAAKEQDAAIDKLAYDKYPRLSEAEIKTLVVDDKWMTRLSAAVQGELDRVPQTLTGRIRELAERYATPLPQLEREVATLSARVDAHLKRMGASWR